MNLRVGSCFSKMLICVSLGLTLFVSKANAVQFCENVFADQRVTPFAISNPIDAQVREVFELLYNDSKDIYTPLKCQYNVVALRMAIEKRVPGVDPKAFKYMIIGPSKGLQINTYEAPEMFNPVESRSSFRGKIHVRFESWRYHVILVYRDVVLDLDYYHSARVLPLSEYFQSMFASEELIREFEGRLHGPVSQLSVWEVAVEGFRPNDVLWYSRNHLALPMSSYIQKKN